MRTCRKCQQAKPDDQMIIKAGKVQTICRLCRNAYTREWYSRPEAGTAHRTRTKARNDRVRDAARSYLDTYLEDKFCADCGETDSVVLEFDHVRGTKLFNLTNARQGQYSVEQIDAEIAKCDIRCANCHRRKTAFQLGWL